MKFEVGDKVVIQHSNDEGEVIEIINDKMVLVDVRGVRFPAYTDQLDFPYFKRFTEKKLFPPKKEAKKICRPAATGEAGAGEEEGACRPAGGGGMADIPAGIRQR